MNTNDSELLQICLDSYLNNALKLLMAIRIIAI